MKQVTVSHGVAKMGPLLTLMKPGQRQTSEEGARG